MTAMFFITSAALLLLTTAFATIVMTPRHIQPVSQTPATPLDQAELILSRRYARGEITAEQYSRMLVILHK